MVPLRVLSRTSLAGFARSTSSSISFASFRLRTLVYPEPRRGLSLRSFSHPDPLFSTTSALFLQNTRGGIPLPELVRCTEAQKCLFVTPLPATLTHSVSRKSFPCHSYANTRDGGVTVATSFERFFSPIATRHFLATLCFRRHMRHVAPLSPVTSVDCAYFLSPRGCTSLCGN